jgi:hypothetical protein
MRADADRRRRACSAAMGEHLDRLDALRWDGGYSFVCEVYPEPSSTRR